MRFALVLFSTLFGNFAALSQNLVPDPSFEDNYDCEYLIGQFPLWHWTKTLVNPSDPDFIHTPDYLNVCHESVLSVPENYVGNQMPSEGNAYIGLVCSVQPTTNPSGYREVVGAELLDHLQEGLSYSVRFKVCRSDGIGSSERASNGLGIKFSNERFHSPEFINNVSHVWLEMLVYSANAWVQFESEFIADSNYRYLHIGNFFDDNQTSIYEFDSTGTRHAYYLIDEIEVRLSTTGVSVSEQTFASANACFVNGIIHLSGIEGSFNWRLANLSGGIVQSGIDSTGRIVSVGSLRPGFYVLIIEQKGWNDRALRLIVH